MRNRSFKLLVASVVSLWLGTFIFLAQGFNAESAVGATSAHGMVPILDKGCFASWSGSPDKHQVSSLFTFKGEAGGGRTVKVITEVVDSEGKVLHTMIDSVKLPEGPYDLRHVAVREPEEWDPTWDCRLA